MVLNRNKIFTRLLFRRSLHEIVDKIDLKPPSPVQKERQLFSGTAICTRIGADCRSRLTHQLEILQLLVADRLEYGCYAHKKRGKSKNRKRITVELVHKIRPAVDSMSYSHIQTIAQSFVFPEIHNRHPCGAHFAPNLA